MEIVVTLITQSFHNRILSRASPITQETSAERAKSASSTIRG